MGFLSPWLLLGGLAISVPIALHFFYRARYRRLPWAAMDFLRQAIEQTSRRVRFMEWILLALRCLIILALTLALSRPTFRNLTAGGRGESIDAVFVIDTSYSMGARDGDEATRLDRAKAAAVGVIDNLPSNSTVQIYTCSDRVAFAGPVTPGNLDQARQVVEDIQLSSLSGDVVPGLNEAYSALDRGVGSNKEVYLFTDLQKAGWERQAGAVRAKAAEIKQRATLVDVRCGDPDRPVNNVAIADITYPGGIPHTGSRLPVTVLLMNTGANPVKNLTVTLEVDGKQQEKESGSVDEIPPGQTYPVSVTAMLDKPGACLLTARVSSDDLPGDNQLDRLIPVRDRVRVLVVDGTPDVRDSKQSGSHYLRNALLPVPANVVDDYFVKVTVLPADQVGPDHIGVHDVVILCNVPASDADRPGIAGLSKDFVARLVPFVKDGGGMVIGVGDNVVPQRYNAILGSAGAGLLPFEVTETVTALPETPFKPAPELTEAAFLARFREEPFRTVLADAEVTKLLRQREDPQGGGRVLMRLGDRTPWLTGRTLGEGEVLFVGTSLDVSWSDFPAKGGAYLPFVQMVLSHLTGKTTSGTNRTAGEPIVWHPPEAPGGFDLVKPDGQRVKLGKAQGGDGDTKLTVTTPDTTVAGVYRIEMEGDDKSARFAVAPDLRETVNLDSLSDAEAEDVLGFRPVLLIAGADTQNSVTAERSRRELTVLLLLVLFLLALVEGGWAWLCGKAW